MKITKYLVFGILGILALYLIGCVMAPKQMSVVETVEVNAPPPVVFHLVNNLKMTELWNSWAEGDSTMISTYGSIAEGVGAQSSWTSESAGSGNQRIVESEINQTVRSELEFKGFKGIHIAQFELEKIDSGIKINWSFEGATLPFLFRGASVLMGMKKQLRKSYKAGLANLKEISEGRANQNLYLGYTVSEVQTYEKNFIMVRQIVKGENMQQFYASNLGFLFNKSMEAGIEMDGMPCGLFFSRNEKEGSFDMAAAIPLAEAVSIEGCTSYHIPSRNAVVVNHYGAYSDLGKANEAISQYMKDKGYHNDPPSIEEYVTDPGEQSDPAKILTHLTYYYTD